MTSYELGDDGYASVVFLDDDREDCNKIEYLPSEENRSWDEIVNPDLVKLVNSQKLSKENILFYELTDLVRGAYYNEYLKKSIREYLNFRPLPLKTHLIDSKGEKIQCKLFPHQVKALTFMKNRELLDPRSNHGLKGGIIMMKMGLGKTLTAITHSLISLREPCKELYGENGFPTLIIASKTVMLEWKSQGFEKFFGSSVKVLYLHSDYMGKSIGNITRKQVVKYDFVVTTYDVCTSTCRKHKFEEEAIEMGDEHTLMKGKIMSIHCRTREQSNNPKVIGPSIIYTTPWTRVILDESQKMANPDTKIYRYMMAVYGKYKWCLTGTPIRNKSTDLWTQLRFCGYNGIERKIEWKSDGHRMMKHHNLTQVILSMDYEGANVVIPKKHITEITFSLQGREKECYEYVQGIARKTFDEMISGLVDFASVLALFTRLRQCSIAPYLLTSESKREKGTLAERKKDKEAVDSLNGVYKGTLGEWVHDKWGTAGINSSKMTRIITVLSKIPGSEKVLIFSMFTSVLDLLDDAIKENLPSFGVVQIDGDTKGKEREELLNQFRTKKNIRGLLMTYKVGSEGLNLTEATHVICVEPWWTNAVRNQAISRCHRSGQTKEVTVHDIYIQNSIEERVVEICQEKDKMVDSMLEGTGQKVSQGTGLDKCTLGRILGVV